MYVFQFKECEREDEIPTLSGNRFVYFVGDVIEWLIIIIIIIINHQT